MATSIYAHGQRSRGDDATAVVKYWPGMSQPDYVSVQFTITEDGHRSTEIVLFLDVGQAAGLFREIVCAIDTEHAKATGAWDPAPEPDPDADPDAERDDDEDTAIPADLAPGVPFTEADETGHTICAKCTMVLQDNGSGRDLSGSAYCVAGGRHLPLRASLT